MPTELWVGVRAPQKSVYQRVPLLILIHSIWIIRIRAFARGKLWVRLVRVSHVYTHASHEYIDDKDEKYKDGDHCVHKVTSLLLLLLVYVELLSHE